MESELANIKALPGFIPHKPTVEAAIKHAESVLGTTFSSEYRSAQLQYGRITCYGHELTGVDAPPRLDVVKRTTEHRRRNSLIPLEWYVIEEQSIDDVSIWQSPEGQLYVVQPNANPQPIGDSLVTYLSS